MRHRRSVSTAAVGSLELVDSELGTLREVRSAGDWAKVRAMAADGVSKRDIARRSGIKAADG